MIERLSEPVLQVRCRNVVFDFIGSAVETAFSPAGEIEDGFAQGFTGNGPGMHRDAADTREFLNDQDAFVELRGLDRGAPACRAGANDHQIECGLHKIPSSKRIRSEFFNIRLKMYYFLGFAGWRFE